MKKRARTKAKTIGKKNSEPYDLYKEGDVRFKSTTVLAKTPGNDEIKENQFVVIIYKRKKYWAMFRCPCGCGHVISLSLQKNQHPHWTFREEYSRRPSLYPSVFQKTECRSHFFVSSGRIVWCRDWKTKSVATH
jgi:hypothetical protein